LKQFIDSGNDSTRNKLKCVQLTNLQDFLVLQASQEHVLLVFVRIVHNTIRDGAVGEPAHNFARFRVPQFDVAARDE
jgi:hypothetical protein